MSSQSNFQNMYDKFLSHLKASDKVLKVSSNFGSPKSVQEMFSYLWEMEEAHDYIQITLEVKNKNDVKAEQLRKEGNKFYQSKDLPKALEFYNNSIIHSPRPNLNIIKINSDQNTTTSLNDFSKNLSYGYANRSAVLFELGDYEGSLTDISRAFQYGYPTLLKPKLVEREAKCHLAQNNKKEAEVVLNDCISSLKWLGLEERNISQTKKNLESILERCNFTEEANVTNPSDKVYAKHKHLSKINLPPIPPLGNANIHIPCLNSALDLSYIPEKGRFLIANRDIMPGEILIKEKGFSCVVLPPVLLSHCSNCLKRTFTPVPCPNCISVIFCCEDCCEIATNMFHSIECPLLPTLVSLDMGKNAILALRLVVQLTLSTLKENVPQYLRESVGKPENLAGFNDKNVYSSDDYRTIYHLVTNKQSRSVGDLFKRCSMAVCLIKLLQETNYFTNPTEAHSNDEEKESIFLIGNVLFNHLMNLPCNAHSITELAVNSLKYQDSYMEEVGAGAFGVLSLTNHSCNPSLARSCYGSTIVARAIQFIQKGSEVTDSYGEHYAIQGVEERQNSLRQQYLFVCSCVACTQRWPIYTSLSANTLLKCPKCGLPIDINKNKCSRCQYIITNITTYLNNTLINLKSLHTEVLNSVEKFKISYQNVLNGNVVAEDYQNITNVIYMLGKFTSLPNKMMFEAQETMKHCFDRKGSHYYQQ